MCCTSEKDIDVINLRRITILTLFVLPMITLCLMMLGIAYTHAAILHKASGHQHAAGQHAHETVPGVLKTDAPLTAAEPTITAIISPAGSMPFGATTETVILVAAGAPFFLILLINFLHYRENYRRGVGEGSVGSSNASSL